MINSAQAALHTRAWMDATGEGRFQNAQVDMAINIAISNIIKERASKSDNEKSADGMFASRSLRSELMPLLVKATTLVQDNATAVPFTGTVVAFTLGYAYSFSDTVTQSGDYLLLIAAGFKPKLLDGNIVQVAGVNQIDPSFTVMLRSSSATLSKVYTMLKSRNRSITTSTDKRFLFRESFDIALAYIIGVRIKVAEEWIDGEPATHDQLPAIKNNPFRRPCLSSTTKQFYYIEEGAGVLIEAGKDGVVQEVEMLYLPTPSKIFSGIEYDLSQSGTSAILLNQKAIVRSEFAIIDSITYLCGDEVVMPAYTAGVGMVAVHYVNSEIPSLLHDEICRSAASVLAVSTNNKDKTGALQASAGSNV